MYVKYKLIKKNHILHAIRYTSIPCVKIHAINLKNNQNFILRNRQSAHLFNSKLQTREFSLVFRGIKGLLKLRYVMLGSAVGGGYQVKKKYDEFVSGLPDTQWITDTVNSLFKDTDTKWITDTVNSLFKDTDKKWITDTVDSLFKDTDTKWINSSINNISRKMGSISENTLNWIKEAKEAQENAAIKKVKLNLLDEDYTNEEDSISAKYSNSKTTDKTTNRLQEELIETEIKYKKKLEQLEKEKEELKRQILILKGEKKIKFNDKPLKKSLIDLYSEVLDELQDYDSPYDVQDMLPRVVVVGDQSAGKTSVLEMIANARIFPRGQGEMMTRSPVQVTLRQGPYNIAKFNDSEREYNLKDENDLEKLRNEIEYRMKFNVKNGQTISTKVISLYIQGPNLKRVVLVDLPGIINTVTTEMKPETKEEINKMTNYYMKNPNSIILCIQDGSVDVEKSLVTDLVSKADPDGRRTIFVLTKVDLAEKSWKNPDRLKKILDGKLFPMKALGYFGVVTGKGRTDETIDDIKQYEENFFKRSKLVRDGVLILSKCTTSNLSEKVSDCFWDMVKSTVELQADTFRAIRFNLETQWRNEFPNSRELTREDLFEKAKSELLDEVVNLSLKKNQYWEEQMKKCLWNKTKDFIFDNVFFPSYLDDNNNLQKTKLEINLNALYNFMPSISIQSATDVFLYEFKNLLLDTKKVNYDEIYDKFKYYICEERLKKFYKWESKAEEVLKIIQFVALQNNSIPDNNEWKNGVNNLQNVIKEKLKEIDLQINELVGPSYMYSWLSWSKQNKEQLINSQIKNELDKLLNNKNGNHKYQFTDEDRKFVKTSLELLKLTVNDDQINKVWDLLIRKKILNNSLDKVYACRNGFQYYQHGLLNEIECEDLILFWRIDKMLTSTASSLRMQLVDREYQRLHDILKDILIDVYQNKVLLKTLFTGKRIDIVEELNKVRNIQKKLEYFITQLNKEKRNNENF